MAKNNTPLWYSSMMDNTLPKKPLLRNCAVAFLSGGIFCALAELGYQLLQTYTQLNQEMSSALILLIVISVTALLTGLGIYDKFGQKLGAGLATPISGFANSVTASMLEHRSEGMVLGSGCNSFKLAGAVVVYGIFSAAVVTIFAWIIGAV